MMQGIDSGSNVAITVRPPVVDDEVFRLLRRAREFIAENFDRRVTLPLAASEACLSPFHFQRRFSEAFGESPHSFLTRMRLEHAKRLLRTSDWSVSEICLEVGYESLGTFSAMFARQVGCPPTRFRQIYAIPLNWGLRVIPACMFARFALGGQTAIDRKI